MVYVTKTGRRLPDTIHFDPVEVRRVLPKRLYLRGYSEDEIKRAMDALEDIIQDAEPEKVGAAAENG